MESDFYSRFHPGDRVKHFKRELQTKESISKEPDLYHYEIVGLAAHTETEKPLVIYKALYSKDTAGNCKLYARPLNMFISEVDHKKYPNVKQNFRFEKID
jgi:hypothetical protein